ncbi:MAG: exopolyphosphatase, partial [Alkalispirochaetaceae bacterium]
LIEEIKFVHPKDMQDGLIGISEHDITTNLPYVPGVHLAFDHHYSEALRLQKTPDNCIIDPDAPSTARVVFNYYGGKKRFSRVAPDMLEAVDKADSAQFTQEEVLHPTGWVLLNFIMDARTGLGRFRNFRISNYQLMMDLIDYCRDHTIDEILELSDVQERVELFYDHQERFRDQIKECARVEDNVLVVDLRSEDVIYAGNRFVKYALYPECNVSVQAMWGFKRQNAVLTVGKSIFNRTCARNVGEIMLRYGGGGHIAAGTCQVPNDEAEGRLAEIIEQLKGC